MESYKRNFIQTQLTTFNLTENQKNQVVENMTKQWRNSFDVFLGASFLQFFVEKGIDPSLAFTITESVRKGSGLTEEWKKELSEKDISSTFFENYQPMSLDYNPRKTFEGLLLSEIQQVQQ